jgi:hypothetical protein
MDIVCASHAGADGRLPPTSEMMLTRIWWPDAVNPRSVASTSGQPRLSGNRSRLLVFRGLARSHGAAEGGPC